MNPTTTPRGAQTSEFWMVVAAVVLAVARVVAQAMGVHFSPDASAQLTVATALPAIYALARTWLKIHVPTLGNQLPDTPSDGSPAAGASVEVPTPQPPLSQSMLPTFKTVTQVMAPPPSPFIGADAPAPPAATPMAPADATTPAPIPASPAA